MWWWKTWGLPYVNSPPAMISPEYKPSHKTCGLVKAETPSPTIAMAETLSTRIAQAFLLVPCQIALLMAEFCISRRKLVWRVDSTQDWLRNECCRMPSWISCRPRRGTNITKKPRLSYWSLVWRHWQFCFIFLGDLSRSKTLSFRWNNRKCLQELHVELAERDNYVWPMHVLPFSFCCGSTLKGAL